ncbi:MULTISPECIES: transcription termination/antitermination NusG family protein [unclassified Mesorhizobium]|uniref:transcription termination/antitermination protein NusG n=1 Tax=unclassified Mesorhizobium TaxID=325217 RepID=UPI00112A0FC4|nr:MULTISPECIES: transcription termination/antitermination NusG family protein [unclassified Mesorhizobium]TPK42288.1 hypothetical protein FJ550_30090 [Mesorhizobium sp. B2-5-2]TPL44517.1 hypothetical protein FJ961_04050 [Mesorhizobium sp. B2-4-5]TPM68704.1 hypothetical protein FJ968_29855 [Mesorhizobium sp. B2-1-6]TPN71736.1 hypothetical protein FJ985_30595 [Mesorhizobium sp. B1-1-2]
MSSTAKWFIAKIGPGGSRTAKDRFGIPEERKDEIIAERSIRDEGFECYYPRMRKEIIHHRTNARIVRRFPLFTGYIFVALPSANGEYLKDCDGLGRLLSYDGPFGKPWQVPTPAVEAYMRAEAELEFDDTKESRIKRKLEGKTRRETIQMTFPEGQAIRVKQDWQHTHMLAGFHGEVVGVTGRGTVKSMIEMFGRLVAAEFDAGDIEPYPSRAA